MAMGTALTEVMGDGGPDIFYDEGFRNVLEDHLEYLKQSQYSRPYEVQSNEAIRYEHDFYGLLNHMRIAVYLHWVTMRLNGLTSPTDYRADMTSILVPEYNEVLRLKSMYTTIHRIS